MMADRKRIADAGGWSSYIDHEIKRTRLDASKAFVDGYKVVSCIDCRQSYLPFCMDFDHLDPFTKKTEISRMMSRNYSHEALWQEIQKCELVCANCHRIRTSKRGSPENRANWGKKRRRKKLFVDGYKAASCIDCDNTFPSECMDFDHLDATNKFDGIGALVSSHGNSTLEVIWEEIQKCDLVCAICHRIRAHERRWRTR